MMERTFTCIVCPKSCRVTLRESGAGLSVAGNGCARGAEYARNEYSNPMRMITTTVAVRNGRPRLLPVISTGEVPKASLRACMEKLYCTEVRAPVRQGDVVVRDILGLGVDIVAARNIKQSPEVRKSI
jgi:CxxC motif-containing protein